MKEKREKRTRLLEKPRKHKKERNFSKTHSPHSGSPANNAHKKLSRLSSTRRDNGKLPSQLLMLVVVHA